MIHNNILYINLSINKNSVFFLFIQYVYNILKFKLYFKISFFIYKTCLKISKIIISYFKKKFLNLKIISLIRLI